VTEPADAGPAPQTGAAVGWLVVDAGNTAVKWAISDRDGHRFLGTGTETGGGQGLEARLLRAWGGIRFRAVYATSVSDAEVGGAIERAAHACCGREVVWFGPQRHFEGRGLGHGVALLNGYRDPFQLGADRWHALIAACAKFPDQPLVVVSAGTATTVDCVRAEPFAAAVFVGGVIAPGAALMRQALARGTARLPPVGDDETPSAHAASTEQAIASGVHYAQLGLVENVVREFAAEIERASLDPPRLLLAGGAARRMLAPLSRSVLAERAVTAVSLEQHLVLRGIALRAHSEQPCAAARAGAGLPAE